MTKEDFNKRQLNILLDKISKEGIDSFSLLEKKYLTDYSKSELGDFTQEENQIKFRDYIFEIYEGQLLMTSPSDYEGSFLEDEETVLDAIYSTIADFYDISNREEDLPLEEEEIWFLSNNLTEYEQRRVLSGYLALEVNNNLSTTNVTDIVNYINEHSYKDKPKVLNLFQFMIGENDYPIIDFLENFSDKEKVKEVYCDSEIVFIKIKEGEKIQELDLNVLAEKFGISHFKELLLCIEMYIS